MRIRVGEKRNSRGSVLVVAMGITFILGLGVASYLTLTRWQHAAVVRSEAWNAALALAEAGVEEALAQLNPSALLFTTNINRGANGWELRSDGMYHIPQPRTLPEGTYDVAMTADTYPVIYASGSVTIPGLCATVTRAVKVTTTTASLFRGAMSALNNIDFKGNTVVTDSFDSTDETYSTLGFYDPAKRKANGDVASTQGFVNVQNAEIMGTLSTGPEGNFAVGSQGSVGDLGWVLGGYKGVQPGHYRNDFNMDYPDVLPPYQTAVPPSAQEVDGTNYLWVLGEDNYMYAEPTGARLRTGDKVLVTGRARLYVTGDFIMSGGSSLTIAPGASLQLYVGGARTEITTLNNGGNCGTFSYYGLPGNKSINLSGNNVILGSFYAPSAALILGGGGNSVTDFQGSCGVNSIGMNGHFKFHFDENLRRKGPIRGYQVTSWTEI